MILHACIKNVIWYTIQINAAADQLINEFFREMTTLINTRLVNLLFKYGDRLHLFYFLGFDVSLSKFDSLGLIAWLKSWMADTNMR